MLSINLFFFSKPGYQIQTTTKKTKNQYVDYQIMRDLYVFLHATC